MTETSEKLQKFMARCAIGSRRECETMIASGIVRVNGQVAEVGDRINPEEDSVKVRGKRIRADLELQVFMLHKKTATVCTKKDPEDRPTVYTDLPKALAKMHPIGRLDYHSEGLLLLTNDGDLTLKLTHPRYKLEKTYLVKVRGLPQEKDLEKLRQGIRLDRRRTLPCRIQILEQQKSRHTWLQIGLKEGKKNQIREMFFRIGCPVMRLKRTHVGPLNLGNLPRGVVRPLTERELMILQKAIREAALGKTFDLPKAHAPGPIAGRLGKKHQKHVAKEQREYELANPDREREPAPEPKRGLKPGNKTSDRKSEPGRSAGKPAGSKSGSSRKSDSSRSGSSRKPGGSKPGSSRKPDDNRSGSSRKPDGSRSGSSRKPDGSRSGSSRKPDGSRSGSSRKPDGSKSGSSRKPDGSRSGSSRKPDGSKSGSSRKPGGSKPGSSRKPAGKGTRKSPSTRRKK